MIFVYLFDMTLCGFVTFVYSVWIVGMVAMRLHLSIVN